MSSPYLPLSNIVNVSVIVAPGLPSPPSFNQGLIIGSSGRILTLTGPNPRIRQYSTLAGMSADGFLITDPEYIAASLYFAQVPAPSFVWIGAQDPSGLQSAVPHAGNAGANYKVGDVITVTQGGGSGGTLSVTSIGGGGAVTGLALVTSGHGYTTASGLNTTGGSGTALEVDITAGVEPLLQAVIACANLQSAWYGFMGTGAADADDLAVALWAQSAVPQRAYFYTTADANVLNNVANNIAAVMQAAQYSQTTGIYSTTQAGAAPNNAYAAAAKLGVAMGLNNGGANSFYALFAKQLVGVIPEPLTQTQVTTLQSLNIDIYVNFGNAFTFLTKGIMANGWRWWRTVNLNMLASFIQFACMDVWATNEVVPQTDQGELLMVQAVSGAAQNSRNIGYISPGVWTGPGVPVLGLVTTTAFPSGYLALFQSFINQSQSNRAAGQMMPIYLFIIEAGSGESIAVNVQVQQ